MDKRKTGFVLPRTALEKKHAKFHQKIARQLQVGGLSSPGVKLASQEEAISSRRSSRRLGRPGETGLASACRQNAPRALSLAGQRKLAVG